jgi:predicted amidohydrolase
VLTATPALRLGRPDLADLEPGRTGDVSVLEVVEGAFELVDVTGAVRRVGRKLRTRAVVLAGRLWHEPGTMA